MKRFLGLIGIALSASMFFACSSGGGGEDDIDPIVPLPRGAFVTEWKTDNLGESGSDQIRLPLVDDGTYDFVVDWGDDTTSEITSYDDPDKTHTYASAGTYTVMITGSIEGFSFLKQYNEPSGAYSGDSLKLIGISSWGILKPGNSGGCFMRCRNMLITATDTPDLSETTSCLYMFAYCTSIETIPNLAAWDVSTVTGMNYMFCEASAFNGDVGAWDVSNVTSMRAMFYAARAFNQNLNAWNVSKVINMFAMFSYASSFDGNISSWNVSNVTDMASMFSNSGLSAANYSAFLTGIAGLPSLQSGVSLAAGSSQYTSAAAAARAKLIADYGWTITDGGPQ